MYLENAPEEMNFFNSVRRQGTARPPEQRGESMISAVSPIPRLSELLEEHNDEFDYKVFWGVRSADRA